MGKKDQKQEVFKINTRRNPRRGSNQACNDELSAWFACITVSLCIE